MDETFFVMMKLVPMASEPETARARPIYLSSTMANQRWPSKTATISQSRVTRVQRVKEPERRKEENQRAEMVGKCGGELRERQASKTLAPLCLGACALHATCCSGASQHTLDNSHAILSANSDDFHFQALYSYTGRPLSRLNALANPGCTLKFESRGGVFGVQAGIVPSSRFPFRADPSLLHMLRAAFGGSLLLSLRIHHRTSLRSIPALYTRRSLTDMGAIGTQTVDTTARLLALRKLMVRDETDVTAVVIPSEDQRKSFLLVRLSQVLIAVCIAGLDSSEYIATCDERRAFISGFNGSAGMRPLTTLNETAVPNVLLGCAVVTLDAAYLFTDGRYFLQAEKQLDQYVGLLSLLLWDCL